jgi:hypothetical protein
MQGRSLALFAVIYGIGIFMTETAVRWTVWVRRMAIDNYQYTFPDFFDVAVMLGLLAVHYVRSPVLLYVLLTCC